MVDRPPAAIARVAGPATRSPGRWRAATRASSATCSTRPTSGSRSALIFFARPVRLAAARCGWPTSTCSSCSRSASRRSSSTTATSGSRVPLAYPPLVYLLARMLWLGFRGRARACGRRCRSRWLALAAVVLIAFRVDRQHRRLGRDRRRLRRRRSAPTGSPTASRSTARASSPTTTASATPTGRSTTTPTSRSSSSCPGAAPGTSSPPRTRRRSSSTSRPSPGSSSAAAAAAAAAAARTLGVVLAFAWAAYPYTDFALQSNSNDSLIAALLVWSLALFARPLGARGAARARRRWRSSPRWRWPRCSPPATAACSRDRAPSDGRATGDAVASGRSALFAARLRRRRRPDARRARSSTRASRPSGDRTIASQLDRDSPFSIWGQVDGIEWLQTRVQAAAVGARRAGRVRPPPPHLAQIAALAAAVLIAVQLTVDHWFYLYIPWFFGPWRSRSPPRCRARARGVGSPAQSGTGSSTGSIERARPSSPISTTTPRSPRRPRPRCRSAPASGCGSASSACSQRTPSTLGARAGHADVGDVGGAARQHPGVGGGHVGVGAEDGRDAAVEVPAHRHLLAGHLGVEVDEERVGVAVEPVEQRVGLGERRARRRAAGPGRSG